MTASEAILMLKELIEYYGDLPLYTHNIDNLQEEVDSIGICQRAGTFEKYGFSINESFKNMERRIWKYGD